MPRKTYPQLTELELKPTKRTKKGAVLFELLKLSCCDCGLIHKFAFAIEENGNLGIALRRDQRATVAHRRRKQGFPMEKATSKRVGHAGKRNLQRNRHESTRDR